MFKKQNKKQQKTLLQNGKLMLTCPKCVQSKIYEMRVASVYMPECAGKEDTPTEFSKYTKAT